MSNGQRSSMTTSVYMYESEQMQSTEERLNSRINLIDLKYNQKCQDIVDELNIKIETEKYKINNLIKENNILLEYINLPWYKKLFNSFNKFKYDYERNKI